MHNNYGSLEQTDDATEFPVQIAVAVVEEMGVRYAYDANGRHEMDNVEWIARKCATALHNRWGVGYEVKNDKIRRRSSGTGVLIFLSVSDRVVYISVGGALTRVLTRGRIHRIINSYMIPYLKWTRYEDGLETGIDKIAEILEGGEPPSFFERLIDYPVLVFLGLICVYALGVNAHKTWKLKREKRAFDKAARVLSKIDQAKAEALRGSYQPATSCAICLEEFQSESHGSDGRPLMLLRCGHVFDRTCLENWVSTGSGDVGKCPVCRCAGGT